LYPKNLYVRIRLLGQIGLTFRIYFKDRVLFRLEVTMKTQKVTVINQAGLRSSRIVSILNAKANEFKSQATIRIEDRVINAKSQLGVLSGGISYGTTITLTTSGEDEEEAMSALVKLFQSGFEDY